jgi:tetraacyldisaccharide 4'-kinase
MINKPKFWDKKIGLVSIFLLPVSLIFIFLIFLKKKLSKLRSFKIPVICVGNIYIGGTGKTPIAIFLAKELSKYGKKTALLRKYYKNHIDEYNLIKSRISDLITCEDRVIGLEKAQNLNYDVAILDDGFQDYKINKNLSIICFNQNQLIGNGLVLPSGPLRENLSSLKNADIVIINGDEDKRFEDKILKINSKIEFFYSSYKPLNIEKIKNKRLYAIAAIGNPENFFKLLEKHNLNIEKKLIYPDHYNFSKKQIIKIINEAKKNNCQVIMTEKDYFKINKYEIPGIEFLKVSLEIKGYNKLLDKIKKFL